jgi:predicted nucleic acid-binding protein
MARYVIDPGVAIAIARDGIEVHDKHQLLAPALIRSQLLARLFQEVQRGELDKREAERWLDHIRGLGMRLLGDRVLQAVAWKIADQLGWSDTYAAEYIALTQLQADALVTDDQGLSAAAKASVAVEGIEALTLP